MEENALLEPKLVGEISGNFIVPEYQRGFRWGEEHIKMLLNDIWENGDSNYCLQPIVVKKLENDNFELIDGQQRLTTILLIMKYLKQLLPFAELKFSLRYVTRDRSEEFLNSINGELASDNIDFFHIYRAYQTIELWFNDKSSDKNLKAINLYKYFGERVKVIWYEVDGSVDPVDLFTRLNIGKIPLTNAELVKALFLSKDTNGLSEESQLEIGISWDSIEKELQNESFWAFITNESSQKYSTRIELMFDLMANKSAYEREDFYTFFYFTEKMKSESKLDIWKSIRFFFLTLREWYYKRDIYHKVGYLIAIGERLQTIIKESKDLTKSSFEKYLNKKIVDKLNLTKEDVYDLSYNGDHYKIEKLLLLFNIETVRLLQNSFERYPFETYKNRQWSLEHIHAQNSEGLNKKEDQQKWLSMHRKSLEDLSTMSIKKQQIEELIGEIDLNYQNINKVIFDVIFAKVFAILSENEQDRSYMDSISNMALLSLQDNIALNNSTFDVKRNKILEMDKNGEYIPICTKRVFLKYYTKSKDNQLQFWGEEDRKAYVDAMVGDSGVLFNYLKQNQNID